MLSLNEKIIGGCIFVLLLSMMLYGAFGLIKVSNTADKKYCMEQTTYEYNDCIVKIQG